MRKKPRFTHGRANLRGDASGKRFNTHAMEGIMARIGDGRCGNDKWTESAEEEGWKTSRERMESVSGVRCGIAKGVSCGVRTQGTTRVRAREEPMVRWRRGMAHPNQA